MSDLIEESILYLNFTLKHHCKILNALIAATIEHDSVNTIRSETAKVPSKTDIVLPILLQAAGSSSNTLSKLSDSSGMHTRDCYSIARSIIEVSSNICFIIAEGPEAADRALRHSQQKSHRDLKRESLVGDSKITLFFNGIEDLEDENIKNNLDEFTTKSNREKNWVDATIDQRIEVAGRLGGKVLSYLHMARFIVYRHSSEILHGSFFGAMYFFGATAPPRRNSLDDFKQNFSEHHIMIMQASILSLAAVIEAYHIAYGFAWAYEESDILLKKLKDIPYFAQVRKGKEVI